MTAPADGRLPRPPVGDVLIALGIAAAIVTAMRRTAAPKRPTLVRPTFAPQAD